MVDLWFAHHAGRGRHLPIAGGLGDQPAALMDAFHLLDMMRDARAKDGQAG